MAYPVALALLALSPPLTSAEVSQKQGVRVSVKGKMTPSKLPRRGAAPVAITIGGRIGSTASGGPPQLRRITLAINRHGNLTRRGLPLCRVGHIDPSTTREALLSCRPALIGEGRFSANVRLPEQSPFPSHGRVLAFNGRLRGHPAILANIYGAEPAPTSCVLPFLIYPGKGAFATVLEASLPRVTGDWGYVTGISLTLSRRYRRRRRSYLSATPAPAGFRFAGGLDLTSTLNRSCQVRR